MLRIAVLISGNGSNLQAVIDAMIDKKINIEILYVVADRECYGLERAKKSNIKNHIIDRKTTDLSKVLHILLENKVDLIVLAGFLSFLSEEFCEKWKRKIINIHPSLLPKYGGDGMYGIRIHNEVLKGNEFYTGATVHYVDKVVDGGEIIIQKKLKIPKNINAEKLQKLVITEIEHKILIEAIDKIEREFNL